MNMRLWLFVPRDVNRGETVRVVVSSGTMDNEGEDYNDTMGVNGWTRTCSSSLFCEYTIGG